jgi:hypothetical protein
LPQKAQRAQKKRVKVFKIRLSCAFCDLCG